MLLKIKQIAITLYLLLTTIVVFAYIFITTKKSANNLEEFFE